MTSGPNFQGWFPVLPWIASLTWPKSSTSFCDPVYVSCGFSSGIAFLFLKAEFLTLISVPDFSKFLETVFFLPKTHNVMSSLPSGSIRGAVFSGSHIGHCDVAWCRNFSISSAILFFSELKFLFVFMKLKSMCVFLL